MLTLKEPIKLNISDGLVTVSDSFYERICGNYEVLTASITPKELLFYLSAPPELPEDMGGMTTFAIQNNITDSRAVTMDVVNNVVNRILLSQSNDFTYQDQIYIDSVLHKLGVTDVNLFMKQVQKLQSEQTDLHQLLKLYKQEVSLRAAASLPEERARLAADSAAGAGTESVSPAPRYYLHNDIYDRLETKAIYDTVNAYQQEQSHYFGSFQKNELKTSEQLFVSNLLSLSELRQQALQSPHLSLTYAVNHFELGDMLPPPENEEQVLSQAAAAALVSTVEHVLVQKLSRQGDSRLWLSLENSLSETIENTVSRFQSFHSGDAVYLTPEADISLESTNTYKTESSALEKLVTLREQYSEAVKESYATFAAMGALPLELRREQEQDEEQPSAESSFYSSSSETKQQLGDTIVFSPAAAARDALASPITAAQRAQAAAQAAAQIPKSARELRLEYALRESSELLRDTVLKERSAPPQEAEAPASEPVISSGAELIETIRERVLPPAAPTIGSSEYYSAETTNIDNSFADYSVEQELRQKTETAESAPVPPTPAELAHPVSDTEAPPELLAQEVAEINRRNRERFQQLQSTRAEKVAESIPVPDKQRIMSDALRSLTSPEAVLKEALGEPPKAELMQPKLPPEAAAYLSGADPATRELLQTVMRLESGVPVPEGAGMVRSASLGELNSVAALHPPVQEQPPAEAERPQRETVKLTERADTLLEQYVEAPTQRVTARGAAAPMPKAAIVHRQEQSTFSEELLEQLEQQRSRENITTTVTDNITNRESHELVQNEVTNQVVTQSTEDITQLVNRAISKQMGVISDKVYHQMEKRLQTERSRRGRL